MGQDTNVYEAQLSAMRAVMEALAPLDDVARESVLRWVDDQLGRRRAQDSARPGDVVSMQQGPLREGTVSVVAQKISAKSARELLLAAAIHLALYQGKDSFSKDELVSCAKDARSWKADYSNQIALNIKRMLDAGTLFEKAKNVFSLSSEAMTEIEPKLAT